MCEWRVRRRRPLVRGCGRRTLHSCSWRAGWPRSSTRTRWSSISARRFPTTWGCAPSVAYRASCPAISSNFSTSCPSRTTWSTAACPGSRTPTSSARRALRRAGTSSSCRSRCSSARSHHSVGRSPTIFCCSRRFPPLRCPPFCSRAASALMAEARRSPLPPSRFCRIAWRMSPGVIRPASPSSCCRSRSTSSRWRGRPRVGGRRSAQVFASSVWRSTSRTSSISSSSCFRSGCSSRSGASSRRGARTQALRCTARSPCRRLDPQRPSPSLLRGGARSGRRRLCSFSSSRSSPCWGWRGAGPPRFVRGRAKRHGARKRGRTFRWRCSPCTRFSCFSACPILAPSSAAPRSCWCSLSSYRPRAQP